MKRFTHLASSLVLLLVVAFSFSTATTYANRPAGEGGTPSNDTKCMAYDGQNFAVNSKKDKAFTELKCAKKDGGNCRVDVKGKDGNQRKYVKCTAPSEESDDPASATPDSCSDDKDCISDPALNNGASCNKDSCPIVDKFINPFIGLLSVLVGLAVVIGIIYGAIQVMTSAGDPQKAASGKNHIRNALIALVAYVLLYAFLQWVVPGGVQ